MLGALKQKFSLLVGILVTAVCAIISFASCENAPWSHQSDEPNTEINIASEMDAILNPMFSSTAEVKDFRNRLIDEFNTDVCFRSMPDDVLFNVSTVCLKKSTYVTKKDIVEEYRANQSVYDNLSNKPTSDQSTSQKDTATVVEGQPTLAPLSTSYHYEVDTINGKPVKVLIKEEKYESK